MFDLPSFKENKKSYLSLFGGFLIHVMIGTFYLWGSINIYVSSYLRKFSSSITIDDMNSTFPFTGLTMGLLVPFGLEFAHKVGYRKQILLCTIFFSLCCFVSSFMQSFYSFVLVYGLGSGIFTGIVYLVPYYVAYSHFPDNKGFASGVISSGFGISTLIFSWVSYLIVNPNNEQAIYNPQTKESYYSDEIASNVPLMLRILSATYLGLGTLGCLLITIPEKNEQIQEQQQEIDNEQDYKSTMFDNKSLKESFMKSQINQLECPSIKQGLKTPLIYITIILITLYSSQGNFIIDNYQPIAQQLGQFTNITQAIAGSLGSISNGVMRILWGRALDKYSFKKLALFNLSIEFILMISFQFACKNEISFVFSVCCMLACFGGWSAKMPALLAQIYGKNIGSTLYGITVQGQTIACWTQFFIVKYLRKEIGWVNIFYVYSGIICFGILLTSFVKFQVSWGYKQVKSKFADSNFQSFYEQNNEISLQKNNEISLQKNNEISLQKNNEIVKHEDSKERQV